jgi:hypothetical protein
VFGWQAADAIIGCSIWADTGRSTRRNVRMIRTVWAVAVTVVASLVTRKHDEFKGERPGRLLRY